MQYPRLLTFDQSLTPLTGTKSPKRHELIFAMARCMLGPLAAAVLPRLSQTFFRYMQPFLIRRVTVFINQHNIQSATNQGWGLTAAYGLVYIGITVSNNINECLQVY
jgi:ATP-binding cassette subfamily C (CFTR/MRP) protein 1